MLSILRKIFLNRNFILVFALIMGFAMGKYAELLKPWTIYVLAITMIFSTTGIATNSLYPIKKLIEPMLIGTILNYVFFGLVVIGLATWLINENDLFVGFVVIAVAPPGVAVIPFTGILKGDMNFSIIGVLGAFIASIFIAPVTVGLFPGGEAVKSLDLFILMIKLVLAPILISRLLLHRSVKKSVFKIRGKVVDWGFALIIYTAIGINREVIFSDRMMLVKSIIILGTAIFAAGAVYDLVAKRIGITKERIVSQKLLLTIKSSGFSVVTALTLFGEKAAIPSAVLAVLVLLFLLYLSFVNDFKK